MAGAGGGMKKELGRVMYGYHLPTRNVIMLYRKHVLIKKTFKNPRAGFPLWKQTFWSPCWLRSFYVKREEGARPPGPEHGGGAQGKVWAEVTAEPVSRHLSIWAALK